MKLSKRTYLILGVLAAFAMIGTGAAVAATGSSQSAPSQIDDGAELIDQAGISLDDAIAAAQTAGVGAVGEIDLEMYQGTLVFNVDIGNLDVKVDASNGAVLGQESDDEGDTDDANETDDDDDGPEDDDGPDV